MIYSLLQKLLFALPPEISHHFTLKSLKWFHRLGLYPNQKQTHYFTKTVIGLEFPNSIGLAAGLDKNGEYIDALAALGFGFVEIGTITPKPQLGNKKPRLFRIYKAKAIINRMGFNNHGVEKLIQNVKNSKYKGILGINIGKNAATPLENAAEDYVFCLEKVYPFASYIVVNISSPNTPGLRQLQETTDLDPLLKKLKDTQAICQTRHQKYVPLLIKIAPDLEDVSLKELAKNLLKHHIDGVIATNTTLSRTGVEGLPHAQETGGLSGQPVFERSLNTVKKLHTELEGKIPIIACGGIYSDENAKKMLEAGAKLFQVYTGLIYQGPGLIKKLKSI